MAQRLARATLQLATGQGHLAHAVEVAVGQRREQPLDPGPEGAEAHDAQPSLGHGVDDERPGGHEEVDALRHDELADEGDDAVALGVQGTQRRRRARLAPPGGGGGPIEPSGEGLEALRGLGRLGRTEGRRVHAGRAKARLSPQVGVAHDLPQALGGMA